MPFWAWLLVDLGIVVLGAAWLGYLAWDLAARGERLLHAVQPSIDQAQQLIAEVDSEYLYQRPTPDTESDLREMNRNWLSRMAQRERKKQARQRRLIARLRK